MSEANRNGVSRRDLLKTTTAAAATSALAGTFIPNVHAGQDETVRLALVGCGGRGTGAAFNALSTEQGPTKLVAMADVFPERLASSHKHLSERFGEQVEVPEDRQFIGFDAYKKAIDCLSPGDVVMFTTPPAFRWVHFTYAIEKGINTFMEKPVTVDGPSSRKMLELNELAKQKDLKVGIGLMCRHCAARQELYDRIKAGEIGDLLLLQAYRMVGPASKAFTGPKPNDISELMYQVKQFHSFLWASGGVYSDYLIHNIDECCWMKDGWPVEAKAVGGRHYRSNQIDQNFDNYSVEYTFEDGTKLYLNGRNVAGCHQEFASYAHGTKGSAVISTSAHTPAKCRIYKGHKFDKDAMTWRFPPKEPNPYQLEWEHLMQAIRRGEQYNEVERGVKASVVTSMGRMAAHTGQIVTYDDMLNCEHEFAPTVADLTLASAAPLTTGPDGTYPQPAPGIKRDREY